jgi:hypothetical protein
MPIQIPTFHFDANPDPDPDPSPGLTHIEQSEILFDFYLQQCHIK